jgi:hypothetical protein
MNDDIQKLQREIAELRQHNEATQTSLAATHGAMIVLIRYFAEGGQLYVDELCSDLDKLCVSHPDGEWQRSLMALTEGIRGIAAVMPSSDG